MTTGEPARAYVVNMLEYESVGSFHLYAETFDVDPAGMGDRPAMSEDTIVIGQGQRAMLEFTLATVAVAAATPAAFSKSRRLRLSERRWLARTLEATP